MKPCSLDFKSWWVGLGYLLRNPLYPSRQSVTAKIWFHCKIVWHDGVRLTWEGLENSDDSELCWGASNPPISSACLTRKEGQVGPGLMGRRLLEALQRCGPSPPSFRGSRLSTEAGKGRFVCCLPFFWVFGNSFHWLSLTGESTKTVSFPSWLCSFDSGFPFLSFIRVKWGSVSGS